MNDFVQLQHKPMPGSAAILEAQRRAARGQLKCQTTTPVDVILAGVEVLPIAGTVQGIVGTAADVGKNIFDGKPEQIPGSIISGAATSAAGIFPGGAIVAREVVHGAANFVGISPNLTPTSAVGQIVRNATCQPQP